MEFLFYVLILIAVISCNNGRNKSIPLKSDTSIAFRIVSGGNKKIHLYQYQGANTLIVDSTLTDSKGYGSIHPLKPLNPGVYKFQIGPKSHFNLIINNEAIKFSTFIVNAEDSMRVEQSEENAIYYQYFARRKELNKKLSLLYPLVKQYPKTEGFYKTLLSEFKHLQDGFERYTNILISEHKATYVAKYINYNGFMAINPLLSELEQRDGLIKDYFSKSGWADSALLNSDAIPSRLNMYLALYANPQLSPNQQDKMYCVAVDSIMRHVNPNNRMYDFAVNYLTHIFEQQKMEGVLLHIGQKYLSSISCVNEALKNNIASRIGKYELVSVGKPAPDFTLTANDGTSVTLSKIKTNYTILVFWASWCPHCNVLLPPLNEYVSKLSSSKVTIITVSLDTDRLAWQQAVKGYKWVNCCELNGWNSGVAQMYNIYATPTIFVLNGEKTIIAKPLTVDELKVSIR